ncbi:MAG: hypothetical protein QM777_07010 [Pseudorhodoferax sp.]
MSKAFDSIRQGLKEAIAHVEQGGQGVRMHRPRPVDVRALRAKVEMTQEEVRGQVRLFHRHLAALGAR